MRVSYLRARHEELLHLVEQRTQELRQANQELETRSAQGVTANRALEGLSYVDGLTGVANRRRFEEALDVELRRTYRSSGQLSLVMVDIDFFKNFSDEYGHQAGDDCLKRVASMLATASRRAEDLVARYGGEEFVVVLPGADLIAASALAEQVRKNVEDLGIAHKRSAIASVVTISLGVTSAVGASELSESEVISAADEALYRAKRGGRNRVETLSSRGPEDSGVARQGPREQ